MSKSESYIKVYNCFTDGEDKLSPSELYIYALLSARRSPFLETTETTINSISQIQTIFNDKNRPARNAANTKKIMLSLHSKGIIDIQYKGELGNNTLLRITFPSFPGHEEIYRSLYDRTDNADEFYVLCIIKRFNKIGYEKALDKWSDVLGYASKNTGIDIIKRMEKKKLIYSVEGKKYRDNQGRIKRYPTKYYLSPIQAVNELVPLEDEDVIPEEKVSGNFEEQEGITQEDKEKGNWDGNENLNEYDMIMYLESDDPSFISMCEKKIERISKTDKGKYVIDQLIKKAKGIIEGRQRYELDVQQHDKYIQMMNKISNRLKEKEQRKKDGYEIARLTHDVALVVDGKLIPYSEYTDGKIEEMHGIILRYESSVDGYVQEKKQIFNPSMEEIEFYRPLNNNGEWRENYESYLEHIFDTTDYEHEPVQNNNYDPKNDPCLTFFDKINHDN